MWLLQNNNNIETDVTQIAYNCYGSKTSHLTNESKTK